MSTLDDNLAKRMRVTRDSELEPELITPQTAGQEELGEYDDMFPLVRQSKQTNMRSTRGRGPGSLSIRHKRDEDQE